MTDQMGQVSSKLLGVVSAALITDLFRERSAAVHSSGQPIPNPQEIEERIPSPQPGSPDSPSSVEPINDGIYIITNKYHRRVVYLEDANDRSPLKGHHNPKNRGARWHVKYWGKEQYSLENVDHKRHANCGPRAVLKAFVEGDSREQLWYIQARPTGEYTIAATDTKNLWALPDNEPDTPIELSNSYTDSRCWWTLSSVETADPVDETPDRPVLLAPETPLIPPGDQRIPEGAIVDFISVTAEVPDLLQPSMLQVVSRFLVGSSSDHKMGSATSSTHVNLPFDILGYIFTHYAKTETLEHPLETLLLVCRSWSDAALGHRALWSHLNVHISLEGPYPSIKIWRSRLPLRLKRCGDTVPLRVDLRHLPSRPGQVMEGFAHWEHLHGKNRPIVCPACGPRAFCRCVREARMCIDEFLLLLAGQDGELCKRWSTLYIDLHSPTAYWIEYEKLRPILRHPMPILNSLTICGDLQGNEPGTFPHTPSLQHLVMVHSEISLPSLQSVRSLNIKRMSGGTFFIPDEARNIEELELEGSFVLPRSMPKLWRLHVAGWVRRPDIEVFQLPKLTHLAIKNHGPHWLDALGKENGIDLSRLVSLTVHLDLEYSYSTLKTNTEEILRGSKNLTIIQGNSKGISMILKLVWETESEWSECNGEKRERERKEVRLLAGQRITIGSEENSVILVGDETCHQLCDVAARLKVDLPNGSWDIYDHWWA